MPKATASAETERHDLKTCPEGFIEARRLTFGEKLQRRAMVSKMKIETGDKRKDFAGEMQLMNEAATHFDFTHCIVDHNLEDADGRKLDLGSPFDIKSLDPRIGEEISNVLDSMNNFE